MNSYLRIEQKVLFPSLSRIAYNHDDYAFSVDEEKGIADGKNKPNRLTYIAQYGTSNIPWDHEIINSFIFKYNVNASWTECNYTWGVFNETTGRWNGAVGQVDKHNDE